MSEAKFLHLTPPPVADASNAMFHTFQGLAPTPEPAQDSPKPQTHRVAKRITTPHACAECKRRKIRCDGKQPCGQCVGCRSPKPCHYDKHRQRVIPSRKTLEALQQSLDECGLIIKRLYPTRDPQTLRNLTRPELIALLDRGGAATLSQSPPTVSQSSIASPEFTSPLASVSGDDQGLANLEQVPRQNTEWDEERRDRDPIPVEADDVNALSLSVDRQSSYLGVSSIKAAIRVMLRVAPRLRSFLMSTSGARQPGQSSSQQTPRPAAAPRHGTRIRWTSEGQTLIDAYFNRIHIFVPMLDEPSFRADYLNGRRNDLSWLALLNMVFAMGSIAAMKSSDNNHAYYYDLAKVHLDVECFGSGHLETLQAFALMGGFYLHYVNRPNMANAVTGAAFRMACALGLHRECLKDPNANDDDKLAADLRRRTWWSLYCLDTWGSTTLGRPSLGRSGPAITIRPPEGVGDDVNEASAARIRILPLIENIKFCKIATKIQDALTLTPLLRAEDRNTFDSQLTSWAAGLPLILCSTDPCPEALYTARCVMKWRYQNLRIVLHRPTLLNLAIRSSKDTPSPAETASLETCRTIAKQTIEDITREWARNQFSGWNAAWFLYQASMIPLVSIFWEHWKTEQVREWQSQVETVIKSLGDMIDWSLAASRSKEVVSTMYEASKRLAAGSRSPRLSVSSQSNGNPKGPNRSTDGDTNGTASGSHGELSNEARTSEVQEAESRQDRSMDMAMDELDLRGSWNDPFWSLADELDISLDGVSEMEFEEMGQETYDATYMMQ